MNTYYGPDGALLKLGASLGAGGEATVYALAGDATQVAKIYRAPTGARIAKLRMMVAHPPADPGTAQGRPALAWPTDLVLDAYGGTVGFLMPRVDFSTHRPLLDIYNPRARMEQAIDFTWEYLLRTAANLASVVAAVHEQGYVIGDLNESNLLVSNTALVTLIDCDSMQVPGADGRAFRCPVGKPEYTPPELQGRDFSTVDRAPAADDFGLAVLVFLLLMEGVHPFQGVWLGAGDPPVLEDNIAAGRCPYAGAHDLRPPPHALPFNTLPPGVQGLMLRCFGPGCADPAQRPRAAEWLAILRDAETDLATCRVNRQHRYSAHLGGQCPWCTRITRARVPDPFPPPGTPRPVSSHRRRSSTSAPTPAMPRVHTTPSYVVSRTASAMPAWTPPAAPRLLSGSLRNNCLLNLAGMALILLCLVAFTTVNMIGLPAKPSGRLFFAASPSPAISRNLAQATTNPPTATALLISPTATLVSPASAIAAPSTPGQAQGHSGPLPTGPGRIAFVSTRDGNQEIYVMNADGSGQTRLTDNPAIDRGPAWSPGGAAIAFSSTRDGAESLFIMPAEGGPAQRLIADTSSDFRLAPTSWYPAWSPDGAEIAFVYRDYMIYLAPALQRPLMPSGLLRGWDPAWSPDSRRLVFVSDRDDSVQLYLMNDNGSGVQRLTNVAGIEQGPAWSPDGRQIAFTANGEIDIINADGSNLHALTSGGTSSQPAWAWK